MDTLSFGLLIGGLLMTHLLSQVFLRPFSDGEPKAYEWQNRFSNLGFLIPGL